MTSNRAVMEGPQSQGPAETVTWAIDIVGTLATVGAVTVTDRGANVTSTVMPTGTPSKSGQRITLPPLKNLIVGHAYHVSVLYSDSLNTLEVYFDLFCS